MRALLKSFTRTVATFAGLACLACLAGAAAHGQTSTLVKDINLGQSSSSNAQSFTDVNGITFFVATDLLTGAELWKTDGTAAGTVLVKDIFPGPSSSSPAWLTNLNGTLYFSAQDANGRELWESDGTESGTVVVKDIWPGGASSSNPTFLTNVNGTIYFQASDALTGRELWKSDGTAAGTVLVKDIWPGGSISSSNPAFLTNVNGTVYFQASDGLNGVELWKSDGTAAGTVLVKDILPGSASSIPVELMGVNGTLYFQAGENVNGRELWKSDGTAAGTVLVKDIFPGAAYSDPREMTDVNGTLYFVAQDNVSGRELWKSDGTAAGTVLVKDISAGDLSSLPQHLTYVNETLYFIAFDAVNGRELWKSDGTAAGTVLVKDIWPGGAASTPFELTVVNGTLYFSASDSVNGRELWKSDGTAAGTVLVKDIFPGGSGSNPLELTNLRGTIYFQARDGLHGQELWKSDGTAAGTVLVKDVRTDTQGSDPVSLTKVADTVFFVATDSLTGQELWKSDGNAASTMLVKNISLPASSGAIELTNVNGTLYFSASDSVNGRELWKSDGTAAGTVLVKDIFPGPSSSNPTWLTNLNGTLYFAAQDNVNGQELWKSDGTAAGTVLVTNIAAGNFSSAPAFLMNVHGTIYFQATDVTNGRELWKSDGTATGTVLLKDIRPGAGASSTPQLLTDVNGTLYFIAFDDVSGFELWKSDGTATGTILVKDIFPGSSSSNPAGLTNVNGTLYFFAVDPVSGQELWKSDGTVAGTVLVKDIRPGASSSSPQLLTKVNGTLYFQANDGLNGTELWKSDGTVAGTLLVKDIYPGGSSSSPSNLTNVNGTLYFQANDGVNGYELWTSDGTAAGTVLADDVWPGANSSTPAELTALGDTLLFVATNDLYGRELWSYPLAPINTAPTADDQVLAVDEDATLPITLTGFDADGDSLIFTVLTSPGHGGLIGSAPNFTYHPNPDYNGPDSFTFTVSDGVETSAAATINITVNAVNDPPTADNQGVSVDEDGSLPILLTGNDPDGDSLTFAVITGPANGALSGTAPNLVYTPNAGFAGADSFTFTASDGVETSAAATINITVNAVNDPPTADNQGVSVDEDGSLPILLTGNDPDGDSLTFAIVTGPANGTLSGTAPNLVYTPNAGFSGADSFTFTASDGVETSAAATISITVNAVNDPPTANNQGVTVDEDGSLPILLTGTDPDGDSLTFAVVAGPANGTLSGTAPNLVYTPSAGFNGADSFTFTVSDGVETSAAATINITVNPVNDAPALAPIANAAISEGQLLAFSVSATDADSPSLTFSATSGLPAGASLDPLTGLFAYTPGFDVATNSLPQTVFSVTISVTDGDLSDQQSFQILVSNVSAGTPPGEDVVVEPVDPVTGTSPITLGFEEVTGTGATTLATQSQGAPPPSGFKIGNNTYFNIETTATFTGLVQVCFDYSGFAVNENKLELRHFVAENAMLTAGGVCDATHPDWKNSAMGCWENITQTSPIPMGMGYRNEGQPNPDKDNDLICGLTASLSPFVLVEGLEIVAPVDPVQINTPVLVSVDLTDSAPVDSLVWNWGDGNTDIVPASSPVGVEAASHAYSEPGVYAVSLELRKNGVLNPLGLAEYQYVVVYDPNGGFVTGGGWIDSPEGAYRANPALVGKATFGFVSKYQKGANKPAGETQFRFKAADLQFLSTEYDWLVVSGAKAQYKGTGEINGQNGSLGVNGYGFLLTATDGQEVGGGGIDKFRLKIWDKDNGDEIVYDNVLDGQDDLENANPQELGGGSIVVHQPIGNGKK